MRWTPPARFVLILGTAMLGMALGAACTGSTDDGTAEGEAVNLLTGAEEPSTVSATAAAGDGEAAPAGALAVSVAASDTTTTAAGTSDAEPVSSTAGSTPTTDQSTTTTGSTTPGPPPGAARVVGSGTAASCTSAAVVAAVAAGGSISFDCGPAPVTITMTETAKVVNGNGPDIVIDGGGTVTLSGAGRHRILYQNTCDQAQGWTTSHCHNQDHPRLTVRNITLLDGNSTGNLAEGGGGGAIFVRGGQLRIENVTFVDNRCDPTGPDLGGAAMRVLSQFENRPVTVAGSTFRGGVCANGGAISSIGVSWIISDSVMTGNRAVGNGANPALSGTPGGGSGGAIYADGNGFTIEIRNSLIDNNHANEGGGAVFFVSNNRTGRLSITDSTLLGNPSDGFETSGYPGVFFLGAGSPSTSGSTLR